jgi:hypothetical protein
MPRELRFYGKSKTFYGYDVVLDYTVLRGSVLTAPLHSETEWCTVKNRDERFASAAQSAVWYVGVWRPRAVNWPVIRTKGIYGPTPLNFLELLAAAAEKEQVASADVRGGDTDV